MEEKMIRGTQASETSGEDMLLKQIDAFRDKAKQLQSLVVAKERRVKELEAMVRAKEERNAQLQEELHRKQRQANGLVADVEEQVNGAMKELHDSVNALEERMKEQRAEDRNMTNEQLLSFQGKVDEMVEVLNTIKGDMSEKVHTESVMQYRNIQDLMKEMDGTAEAEAQNVSRFAALKSRVTWVTVLVVINLLATAGTVLILLSIL